MLKHLIAGLLLAGALANAPAFAASNSSGGTIGRGCTLDPFNRTMRCIDFDHCTIDKNGKRTCPVVVTSTRVTADQKAKTSKSGGKGSARSSDYLVVTMEQVMVSS